MPTAIMFRSFLICCYFCASIADDIVYPCITPNNKKGLCRSLLTCPALLQSAGTLDPSAIEHVKKSICNDRNFMVCCEIKISESIAPATNLTSRIDGTPRDFALKNLIPNRRYCGLQHTDDRIYSANETAIDEFPWLAHVLFVEEDEQDDLEFADRCIGVLINNRYVLTNAECARNPKLVRLGQYNTNKTISCAIDEYDCSESTVSVKIEEQIHRINGSTSSHNVALFRLAKTVAFSDFVRPICLPFADELKDEKDTFLISGWGASNQSGIVKKRLSYTTIKPEECFKLDNWTRESSTNSSYICLETQHSQFACSGEEGGPIMTKRNNQWFVEGVVVQAFTDPDCSTKAPIDGIRITQDIVDWILDTIRA